VAPVLLGDGIRFFDGLENAPIALKPPRVVEGEQVTHLYHEVAEDRWTSRAVAWCVGLIDR
jgi:hypothetical protein